MSTVGPSSGIEEQIDRWRSYLRRRQALRATDAAELEDHLREQIDTLARAGLATDEAFLIAVKRLGNLDALSREFAREHSERLWKQLVLAPPGDAAAGAHEQHRDAFVAFALAVAAGVAIKLPALFGLQIDTDGEIYARNLALFVLPLLTGYFVWKRQLPPRVAAWMAGVFVAAAALANGYPFEARGSTSALTALHLPIALWLVVGIAYAGPRWGEVAGRMDFIRFSGELFIYYVLIALGGALLMMFTALIFRSIGVDVAPLFQSWVVPCGAAGAVLVASWLVEAKQGVIENMAPVLTRLFTPLFAAVLLVFLGTLLFTGRAIDIQREVLIAFDLLLVLVLGLLLYSISARDPEAPPGLFDVLQVVLVACALLADAVALWAIASRISEFGVTPNRVAALGENLILLVNLAGSALLYLGFLRGALPFGRLERWQTGYLYVYAAWGAVVVIAFPPLFAWS